MDKNSFSSLLSQKLKLVRVEYGFSQDKMAEILSISKKTLVDVEKGRITLNWNAAVTLAVSFEDSEVIAMVLGGDSVESIKSLAFANNPLYPKTMGGKVWWRDIRNEGGVRVQQNIVSQHYRLLTAADQRICSSFDLGIVLEEYDRYLASSQSGVAQKS
jgi:DNA-binding XRE family transcriptional regulator